MPNQSPLYSETYYVPDRIFFTLNFFDFPTFKTDRIVFENANKAGESAKLEALTNQQILILVKENYLALQGGEKLPEYRFDIDPSLQKGRS